MEEYMYYGLLPAFFIAIFDFLFRMFSVDRWPANFTLTNSQWFALFLQISSALLAWTNAIGITENTGMALQICSAFIRVILGWLSFIFIYNGRFSIRKQQLVSLLFAFLTQALWQIKNRIMHSPN